MPVTPVTDSMNIDQVVKKPEVPKMRAVCRPKKLRSSASGENSGKIDNFYKVRTAK
jgi:hypothetical protein